MTAFDSLRKLDDRANHHRMRLIFALAPLLIGACSRGTQEDQPLSLDRLRQDSRCAEPVNLYGHEPQGGVVGSAGIAKDVAYRYLNAIYPDDRHLRPQRTSLEKGVWTVLGTLPKNSIGGVAAIKLCQSNGRVLEISHGK